MTWKDLTAKKTVEMHLMTLSLVRGNTLPWHENYHRYFQGREIIKRWIRQVRARKYQSSKHAQATSTRYMCIDTRDLFVDMCNRSNKYQLILIQHLLCIAPSIKRPHQRGDHINQPKRPCRGAKISASSQGLIVNISFLAGDSAPV